MTLRHTPLKADSGLTVRMAVVMLLLVALYFGFLTVLAASGVNYITIAIIAGLMLVAQYFFSDKLVLWSSGAREVSPEQAPNLHARIGRLAAQMDLPMPRVAIVDTDVPNAFATGRSPSASVIAVTTGIMSRLDDDELDTVLAHELSHVAHRDVAVMTIASFFSTVAFFLVRWLMYMPLMGGGMGGRRRDDRDSGALPLIAVWLISIVVWVISMLLLRALSRYRELAADRGSAIATGAPMTLATALQKITGTIARIPQRDLREVQGASAFCIIPVMSRDFWSNLISTHPSLEARIAQLERIQMQMEGR